MTDQTKRVLKEALERYRGDDLERAKNAFRGMSDTELDVQHGQSGLTRRRILEGYQNHVDMIEKAKKELGL